MGELLWSSQLLRQKLHSLASFRQAERERETGPLTCLPSRRNRKACRGLLCCSKHAADYSAERGSRIEEVERGQWREGIDRG